MAERSRRQQQVEPDGLMRGCHGRRKGRAKAKSERKARAGKDGHEREAQRRPERRD